MTEQRPTAADDDAIAWALHRLAASWAADDAHVAKILGVTPGDYLALKHIAVADGLGPAELARRLGMSTGSVNALLNRLEASGQLRRRRHDHDARRLTLHLSTASSAALALHDAERARLVHDASTSLGAGSYSAVESVSARLSWLSTARPKPIEASSQTLGRCE